MERVSTIEAGTCPIIIVCPHGYEQDDENTAFISEQLIKNLGCYGVINRGWERDKTVDIFKDKADCNNLSHCHEFVVKEEFLDPILRYKARILKEHSQVYVYTIHGMTDKHRSIANDPNMDMVIGFGAGSTPSYSCDLWRKDCFIRLLAGHDISAYEGKSGGMFSGHAKNNLNQLFRKWFVDKRVHSMQVEIVHELRKDKDIATILADYMASAMNDLLHYNSFTNSKQNKQY